MPLNLSRIFNSHCFLASGFTWVLAGLTLTTAVEAQQRAGTEATTKTGTLVEVAKKGRAQILKYTDESGEEQEVVLTSRIKVQVEAEGDAGFLRPGQFVAAIATESNKQLFSEEISVYMFGKTRPPGGKIQKAPPKQGQSKNAWQVSGPITSIGPDKDYPEYQRVEVKAAGPKAPLMLEEGFTVTVKSMDLSIAESGTPLELEGIELKNGRFNLSKVTVKLEEPLKAAEVLGEAGTKEPGKSKEE